MSNMGYWQECIRTAFEDVGIIATEKQILNVAVAVEGGHENYSMSHGYDCIPNPLTLENARLESELRKERDKVVCVECKGNGRITTNFANRSSNSQCLSCHGKGYV